MPQPTCHPNPTQRHLTLSLLASSLIGTSILTLMLLTNEVKSQPLQLPGTTNTNTGPTAPKPTRSGLAAQSDPSPFENNGGAVQSAQMQPSLASPFIVLQKVPEPKNKNAIPQDIYKLIGDKKYPEAMTEIDKELTINPRNVQLRFVRSRIQIEMGQIDAAKKTLLELTQQFPELPEDSLEREAQTPVYHARVSHGQLAMQLPSFLYGVERDYMLAELTKIHLS